MIKENRSKLIGVIYILISFYMLILGLNGKGIFFEELQDKFGLFYMGVSGALILGVLSFLPDGLKKATYFSRIIVGSLFLVSGLIKSNDTLGFSFKLEEYFDPSALDWSYFFEHHWSMPLAFFIAAGEVILGLAVLFGGLIRISSWALLGMTLFFAWLTYYTANCNDVQLAAFANGEEFSKTCVTDCGCFGDALKGSIGRSLNPWESFYKDITLLFFVLIIFIQQKKISFNKVKDDWIILSSSILFVVIIGGILFGWWFPLFFLLVCIVIYLLIKRYLVSSLQMPVTALVFILLSFTFASYTYTYLPIKDYRGYALGNDLKKKKNDGLSQVNNNLYTYKHNESGEILELFQEEYMERWKEIGEDYTWLNTQDIIIKEGRPASIQDFAPFQYYQNINDRIKNDSIINQIITDKYDQYIEKCIVLKDKVYHQYDTIQAIDYLPEYYPDSLYENLGLIERRILGSGLFEVDFSDYLMSLDQVLIIVSYDVLKSSKKGWNALAELLKNVNNEDIPVFCLSSMTNKQASDIKKTYGMDFNFLMADATEMKIVVRSNPGLVYLKNAVVTGKWDYNRIPTLDNLNN